MSIFGEAKFGSGKRNWWKLKDGVNGPYRILPPIGDAREEGTWSKYYKIHYGYKNSKGEMRTFESPEVKNFRTKMIDVPDAALNRINELKLKLKAAQDAKNAPLVEELLKQVGGKKSRYNLDANHYLNVIDTQGNIGILKIRHRAKAVLDAKIKELRDNNIEPLGETSGRFFTFTRTGSGSETVFSVSVATRKLVVDGVGEVEQQLVHEITNDLAKRCATQNKDGSFTFKEAGNLLNLFKRPTAEEVERIVREGEKAVDEILDAKTPSGNSDYNNDDSGMEDDEATPPTSNNATANTVGVTTAAPVTAAPTATVTTPPTAPKTTEQVLQTTAEKDFLKSFDL